MLLESFIIGGSVLVRVFEVGNKQYLQKNIPPEDDQWIWLKTIGRIT